MIIFTYLFLIQGMLIGIGTAIFTLSEVYKNIILYLRKDNIKPRIEIKSFSYRGNAKLQTYEDCITDPNEEWPAPARWSHLH